MIEAAHSTPALCDCCQPSASANVKTAASTLGRRASFRVSAGVVGHTFWTSAAPAMATIVLVTSARAI
jgi:hypothetical protein